MTTLAVVQLRANVRHAGLEPTTSRTRGVNSTHSGKVSSSFDIFSVIKVKYIKHKNKNVKISGSDSD